MTKRKYLLRNQNQIFGKEHEQTLKDLGYDKMDSFAQARFREQILRDSMRSAFARTRNQVS